MDMKKSRRCLPNHSWNGPRFGLGACADRLIVWRELELASIVGARAVRKCCRLADLTWPSLISHPRYLQPHVCIILWLELHIRVTRPRMAPKSTSLDRLPCCLQPVASQPRARDHLASSLELPPACENQPICISGVAAIGLVPCHRLCSPSAQCPIHLYKTQTVSQTPAPPCVVNPGSISCTGLKTARHQSDFGPGHDTFYRVPLIGLGTNAWCQLKPNATLPVPSLH